MQNKRLIGPLDNTLNNFVTSSGNQEIELQTKSSEVRNDVLTINEEHIAPVDSAQVIEKKLPMDLWEK